LGALMTLKDFRGDEMLDQRCFGFLFVLIIATGVSAQGNTGANQEAYQRCMVHKPERANSCYDFTCFYQGCIAQYSQPGMQGGLARPDPSGAEAAIPACMPHIQAQIECIRENGVLLPEEVPLPPNGGAFSCADNDNEEGGCCCFRGAHTYLFEPRQVASVTATFDVGRGPTCESNVSVSVQTAPDVWETLGQYSVSSGRGGSDIAPNTRSVTVGTVITGVKIDDGCVCCIDDSSVELN
jgi:hypothetical protein